MKIETSATPLLSRKIKYRGILSATITRQELVWAVKEVYGVDWKDSWRGYQSCSIAKGRASKERTETLEAFKTGKWYNPNYLVGIILSDFCDRGLLPEGEFRIVEEGRR